MKIYWSNESIVKYESIIDNLIENWPITVAQDFEFLTNSLLDNLKLNKKLCPVSRYKKLRKCVIHKNVSLIYRINKQTIEIVTFIINQKNNSF
jgi:mRNA-degrading endonuclease YafQ of YafQ-DinJ toxin-antitoxin module